METVKIIKNDEHSHYLIVENGTYDELELISSFIEEAGGGVIGFDVGEGVSFYYNSLDEDKLDKLLNSINYELKIK